MRISERDDHIEENILDSNNNKQHTKKYLVVYARPNVFGWLVWLFSHFFIGSFCVVIVVGFFLSTEHRTHQIGENNRKQNQAYVLYYDYWRFFSVWLSVGKHGIQSNQKRKQNDNKTKVQHFVFEKSQIHWQLHMYWEDWNKKHMRRLKYVSGCKFYREILTLINLL